MSKTTENLKAAFAGESQANRNYLYYAKIAEKEGNEQIAKLFRAVAAAETVHAHNHKRILGGVENTAECSYIWGELRSRDDVSRFYGDCRSRR
jgi:rubrerythrin